MPVLAVLWLLLLAAVSPAQAEWVRVSGIAMTTAIEMEYWFEGPAEPGRAGDLVLQLFDRIDRQMSRYREDSEVSRVNRNAMDGPVSVGPELFRILQKAREVSELSDGAFDISFGSVGYLYDYRKRQKPADDEIDQRLPSVDYRDVVLNPDGQTVAFRKSGTRIDLGGIAKGFAVDAGIELLKEQGIRHARLSAGGDMRLLGDKRGKPWIVGIRDPRSEDRNVLVMPLSDVAISTSGDYQRFFFDEAGERVHHILSPATGKPAKGVQSVTILGDDALTTDGLSTAVFVLGADRGLTLINGLSGIDAVIVDEHRQVHFSSGLTPPEGGS
jgi:thiamine biosynthesis lipoprotein